MKTEELKQHVAHIRENIVRMVANANSGHPGGSLSAADILTVLYFEVMDMNEDNVKGIDRDRFVLSKGHASPLLYATLFEKGLLKEDLNTFRKINSKLQGHPNMNYVDGVDMSTGSLGQGISAAVGEVWEAAMAAAHYRLNNLCAIVDFNSLQIDGNIRDVMNPTPIDEKFKAFGWNVVNIKGHDYEDIRFAFDEA
uniref:transketolase n=1 Tax=[Eubacterium] hominis TaxID=2764325 RepID=UPI0023DDECC9